MSDREAVVETVLWWQDRCWRGIAADAAAGDPALLRLSASGAVGEVRRSYDWVQAHRARLASGL